MGKLSDKQLKLFRILTLCGLVFALVALFNNLVDGVDHMPFTESLLYPYTSFLVPGTNFFTVILASVYLIFPHQLWIVFFLFFLETVHLILTGFECVGIMLYINFLAVAFSAGLAQKHFLRKLIVSLAILFILLLTLIPKYGLQDKWLQGILTFMYNIALTGFNLTCYIVLYHMLSDKLSFLLGDYKVPDLNPQIQLPQKGEVLDLKALGLTERQIKCNNFTINTSYNYKQIAEQLITSESTVKKDMQDLYKLFGVKNREMLRLLLVQYTVV